MNVFGSRPIFRAGKIPKSFFAPKPYGNACYAGYVFSVRTVSYGSLLFPLRFMARGLHVWTIKQRGKYSVRTVSYGSLLFPLRFMARGLHVWTIRQRGKYSVRKLRYGPRTRLVRGIFYYMHVGDKLFTSSDMLLKPTSYKVYIENI